jgi:hypothetical protein
MLPAAGCAHAIDHRAGTQHGSRVWHARHRGPQRQLLVPPRARSVPQNTKKFRLPGASGRISGLWGVGPCDGADRSGRSARQKPSPQARYAQGWDTRRIAIRAQTPMQRALFQPPQRARNAALASSRLSATPPFGPGDGRARAALCPAPQLAAGAKTRHFEGDDRVSTMVKRSLAKPIS